MPAWNKIHGNTFINALIGMVLAWLLGLALFVGDVMGWDTPKNIPKADGLVVLTGGTLRVEAGLDLLVKKTAPRLLISGVDPRANPKEVVPATHPAHKLLACCIVVGTYAADTWGNAREAAEWAGRYDLKRLMIVTSNYHMRRSLLEFRLAMPDVMFFAYPLEPEQVHLNDWWDSPGTASLLIAEYNKLLLAYVRAPLHKMFDNEPPKEAAKS
jgi:uncharacterized SAM-binding protein YcdF (DUF218 family)